MGSYFCLQETIYLCIVCGQIIVQLRGRVPLPGEYILVVEYASEEKAPQTLTVSVNTPGGHTHQERITLLNCKYRCVYVRVKSYVCAKTAMTCDNKCATLPYCLSW